MKQELEITITPSQYRGWTMEFNEHGDGFDRRFFTARKGQQFAQANSPKGLIVEIDAAEKLAAKLNPTIKCLYRDYHKWERIEIHTVCGDRVFYVDEKGEQGSEFLRNIEAGHREFLLDIPENVSLINEGAKMHKKAADLTRKAEDLNKKKIKLSEADIQIAVKEQAK